jgi:predicted Zn-dependent peptidase
MEPDPIRIKRRYDTAQFEEMRLENGIPVWIQNSPVYLSDEGILIGFLPGVGSCRDPKGQEGVAHFTGRMPLEGTKNFPSSASISAAIEGLGGSRGARTSTEWTRFHVQLARSHFETAARMISEIIGKPLIQNDSVLSQRNVIAGECFRSAPFLGESKMKFDLAQSVVGDYPYNHPVIGRERAIRCMITGMLKDFWERYYHSGNLQLIVGGAFAERPDILDILNEKFAAIRAGQKVQPTAAPHYTYKRFRLTDPRYGRSALAVRWIIAPPNDGKSYAIELLLRSIGTGSDSPLAQHFRDELVKTDTTDFVDFQRFAPFWSAGFIFPIPAKNFAKARDMVRMRIEQPWQEVEIVHERDIARRATAWCDPLEACLAAVEEITVTGHPVSFRELEAEQDTADRPDVERWREIFLTSCVDCEILPVPFPLSRLLSFTGLT